MKSAFRLAALAAVLSLCGAVTHAQQRATFPILVPLTGALALEGQSQRDGALLAFAEREAQQTAELTKTGGICPVSRICCRSAISRSVRRAS